MALFGNASILAQLREINQKLDVIMTSQDDIDAAVAAINDAVTGIGSAVTDLGTQNAQLAADVAAIQAALTAGPGGGVDTTALNLAVASLVATKDSLATSQASLDTAVSQVSGLVPPAPSA